MRLNLLQELSSWTFLIIKNLVISYFLSHSQESQINCIMERCALEPPCILANWTKWSEISAESTPEIPNQLGTRYQRYPKQCESKNKWEAISGAPQLLTQSRESLCIIPRRIKLSLIVIYYGRVASQTPTPSKKHVYGKRDSEPMKLDRDVV